MGGPRETEVSPYPLGRGSPLCPACARSHAAVPNSICAGPQVWPQKGWGPPAETATSPHVSCPCPVLPEAPCGCAPTPCGISTSYWQPHSSGKGSAWGVGGSSTGGTLPHPPPGPFPPTLPHPSSFSGETQWPAHPAATAQPWAGPSGSGHLPCDPQLRKAAPKLVELFPSVDAPESPHLASSEPEVLAQGLGGWGAGWWPGSWLLGLE